MAIITTIIMTAIMMVIMTVTMEIIGVNITLEAGKEDPEGVMEEVMEDPGDMAEATGAGDRAAP
jgi:hypothetical protein